MPITKQQTDERDVANVEAQMAVLASIKSMAGRKLDTPTAEAVRALADAYALLIVPQRTR